MLMIQKALADKRPVVAGSMNMKDEPAMASEARNTTYMATTPTHPSLDLENRTVTLTNPWGKSTSLTCPLQSS